MKTTDNSEKRGEGSVFPPSPFTQKVKAKQEASVSLIMMSKLQVIIAQLGWLLYWPVCREAFIIIVQ